MARTVTIAYPTPYTWEAVVSNPNPGLNTITFTESGGESVTVEVQGPVAATTYPDGEAGTTWEVLIPASEAPGTFEAVASTGETASVEVSLGVAEEVSGIGQQSDLVETGRRATDAVSGGVAVATDSPVDARASSIAGADVAQARDSGVAALVPLDTSISAAVAVDEAEEARIIKVSAATSAGLIPRGLSMGAGSLAGPLVAAMAVAVTQDTARASDVAGDQAARRFDAGDAARARDAAVAGLATADAVQGAARAGDRGESVILRSEEVSGTGKTGDAAIGVVTPPGGTVEDAAAARDLAASTQIGVSVAQDVTVSRDVAAVIATLQATVDDAVIARDFLVATMNLANAINEFGESAAAAREAVTDAAVVSAPVGDVAAAGDEAESTVTRLVLAENVIDAARSGDAAVTSRLVAEIVDGVAKSGDFISAAQVISEIAEVAARAAVEVRVGETTVADGDAGVAGDAVSDERESQSAPIPDLGRAGTVVEDSAIYQVAPADVGRAVDATFAFVRTGVFDETVVDAARVRSAIEAALLGRNDLDDAVVVRDGLVEALREAIIFEIAWDIATARSAVIVGSLTTGAWATLVVRARAQQGLVVRMMEPRLRLRHRPQAITAKAQGVRV